MRRIFHFACYLPLILQLVVSQFAAEECTCEGFVCVSDTEYQLCANGELVGSPIACDTGAVCRNETECSTELKCQETKSCTEEGIFPDDLSDQNYYKCSLVKSEWIREQFACPENETFDREKGRCRAKKDTGNGIRDSAFECPKEGFYPDPEDCRSYFACDAAGFGTRMQCSNDTYYDEESYVCSENLPERCRGDSETVTDLPDGLSDYVCPGVGYYPDPYSCERYIACDDANRSSVRYCSQGTYFDPSMLTCTSNIPDTCNPTADYEVFTDNYYETTNPFEYIPEAASRPDYGYHPPEVGDIPYGPEVSANPEYEYYQTTEGAYEWEATYTTDYSEVSQYPATYPPGRYDHVGFKCPNVGYFPDPDNCGRYYVCDKIESPYPVSCPEGTYYDERSQFCESDLPERCRSKVPNTTAWPFDDVTDQDTEPSKSVGESASSVHPSCSRQGIYPNPEDCHKYYVCNDLNHRSDSTCPNEWYYDESIETCTEEVPERCRRAEMATESVITTIPQRPYFECPDIGQYPDPESCHSYYFCGDWGSPILITCTNGRYYDNVNFTCVDEIPERCKTSGSSETTTEDQSLITNSTNDSADFVCPDKGYFPDPTDCSSYYVCISNTAKKQRCPEGSYFRGDSELCSSRIPEKCGEDVESTTTVDHTTSQPEFVCPGPGQFSHPDDCSRFIVCLAGNTVGIEIACPPGTYYYENKIMCASEMPERCKATSDGVIPTTNPYEEDVSSVCVDTGYYPDPSDCQRYFICHTVGEPGTSMLCPEGTFYHFEDQVCAPGVPEYCEDTTASETPITTERVTTAMPSAPDDLEFKCPGEGFFSDPKNCQNYYMCTRMLPPILSKCPAGSYFDDKKVYCTSDLPNTCRSMSSTTTTAKPAKDEESEFYCPGNGYYPHPSDCHKYYICYGKGGNPLLLSCPSGTFFDAEKDYCTTDVPSTCQPSRDPNPNSPTEYFCSGEGYFPDPKNCHRYYSCYGFGPGILLDCPEYSYFDEVSSSCTRAVPERCRSDDFVCQEGGTFADPKDCQKYWVCYDTDFGFPVKCPRGTYYVEESQFCVGEEPERCRNNEGPSKPHFGDEDEFECPGVGHFPDPADCNKYHVCYSWGFKFSARCPNRTYFHEDGRRCSPVLPERCRNPHDFVCPSSGYFADPKDCHKYYICNFWREKFSAVCPGNGYFHEDVSQCSKDVPPSCRDSDEFVCPGKGFFPDPTNCTIYHICSDSAQPYTSNCPAGTYYHGETRSCSPVIPDRCENSRSIQNDFVCPGHGVFVDPEDCRNYYVCNRGKLRKSCPKGLFFNEIERSCGSVKPENCGSNYTEDFICPGQGVYPHPTDCKKFYKCYGLPIMVECPDGLYFDERTRSCRWSMTDRCMKLQGDQFQECEQPGRYPHPDTCSKYIVCDWMLQKKIVSCPESTYFNEINGRCDKHVPERCKEQATTTVAPTTEANEYVCHAKGSFPDPKNCRAYYDCRDESGGPEHRICEKGKYFHLRKGKCKKFDDEAPEECREGFDSNSSESEEKFQCFQPGLFPDPNDCSKYYLCQENLKLKHLTCRVGTTFNEILRRCSIFPSSGCSAESGSSCHGRGVYPCASLDARTRSQRSITFEILKIVQPVVAATEQPFSCLFPGYYPDPNDPRMYYLCTSTLNYFHLTCPGKLIFNNILRKCSSQIPGTTLGTTEEPTTTEKPDEETTVMTTVEPTTIEQFPAETTISTDSTTTKTTTKTTLAPKPPKKPFKCVAEGIFADEANCKMYYRCTNALQMYHLTCPGRLIFNEVLQKCSTKPSLNCKF